MARTNGRSTNAEMEERRAVLLCIVDKMKPMTVRQVFYQATVQKLIEKTEGGYNKIQDTLADMRRDGIIPYEWIVDYTRFQRKLRTFDSVKEALENTAKFYRKALWTNAESYVEIWLEKDALSGVIMPVTSKYDVPPMVAKGYASLSFLSEAAEYMEREDRPIYVYHLGDHDPSGRNAGAKIESTLRDLAPSADITFERIAVTTEQIAIFNLPSRPTKLTDTRARTFMREFGDATQSVELDAINPNVLRSIVDDAITEHLPEHEYQVLMEAEKSEQEIIRAFVKDSPEE